MADDRRDFGRFLTELRLKDLDGRRALVAELRRKKGERSVLLLLEILCDESWYLRELAIEALGEMPDLAVSPLLSLLKSGLWYTRASAARALGRTGDRRAVMPLVELLDDANSTVSASAGDGLLLLAERGSALAVARAIRSRGPAFCERSLARIRRQHPDDGRKLATLVEDETWMNARGPLEPETIAGVVAASSDSEEGIVWEEIEGRLAPPRAPAAPLESSSVPSDEEAKDDDVRGDG